MTSGLIMAHGNDAVVSRVLTAWLPSRHGMWRGTKGADAPRRLLRFRQGGIVSLDEGVQITEIVFAGGHILILLPDGGHDIFR